MLRSRVLPYGWMALFSLVPVMLMAGGGGRREAQPSTNGTVTFEVRTGNGLTTVGVRTGLSASKPKKTPVVNRPPRPGEVDGRHNFPAGSNAVGMAQYYRGLLNNAGWAEGTDFTIGGGQINFYAITELNGSSNRDQVKVRTAVDSVGVVLGGEPPPRFLKVQRLGKTQDGSITVVAFGLRWDGGKQTLNSTTSALTVHFLASDTAGDILAKIYDAMSEHGWQASHQGTHLLITRNSHGDAIYSIWYSVEYFGDGANDDVWTYWGRE